uniref:Uncharacterized protein n=1 Tax=Caloglossa intermedia TaxID=100879 RepID=A0A1Z1M6N1_9FLOR|nr:hypothetical protein [Caloglossa intermedia]ARW61425.1 hypothetical protein [Caloglossa intermedia]
MKILNCKREIKNKTCKLYLKTSSRMYIIHIFIYKL